MYNLVSKTVVEAIQIFKKEKSQIYTYFLINLYYSLFFSENFFRR